MLRLIIVINILISSTASWCQQEDLTARLLQAEKKIFEASDSMEINRLIVEKIAIHTGAGSFGPDAMREVLRADPAFLAAEARPAFYWNASILSFLNKETYKTLHYIDAFESLAPDSTVQFLLIKYIAYLHYDTLVSNRLFERLTSIDPSLGSLQCISAAEEFELRHRAFRQYASFIIPGSGMIMNGNAGRGTIALALNAATVCMIVYMAQHQLILNAIGWGSNLAGKFYTGNLRLTGRLIDEKEQKSKNKLAVSCEKEINNIFERYPLRFR